MAHGFTVLMWNYINKQYHHSPHNTFINMAQSKLYADQLFMQLLHTPWSIIFIMYEDSTIAVSVKNALGEKLSHIR